ncbi:hypothetical protein [Desulfitobacterium sp.]|nr:hypothetical protein [Desulfitobacterium sp.]MEA4900899.1 hypothetical protein [Desulfitobacterium sp.]
MKRLPIRILIEKEELAILLYMALSLLLALAIGPEVGTSGQAPLVGQAAAPWIFGPVQFLLFYFSPWISAIFFPVIFILTLAFLPWINAFIGDRMTRVLIAILSGTILILLIGFMFKEQVTL